MARSMPLSPAPTSRGLHWIASLGFATGFRAYGRRAERGQAFIAGVCSAPMAASDPRVTPTGVKAPHGARIFEISWADGATHRVPHRILRGYCPCAGCQGHGGITRFID